jgi:hypothetical protein
MSDITFETKMEQYLSDHEGNLNTFYTLVSTNYPVGHAFLTALSRPDIYRLIKSGDRDALANETEFDSQRILEAIESLEESATKYPEDHPIWGLR